MKISNEVLDILKRCTITGSILKLPAGKLDRNLYMATNKVLECLGGKWNRGEQGHKFDGDPNDALELTIMTGEVTDAKKEFQFFETPTKVIQNMIDIADIGNDMDILEPSAGKGAIIAGILKHNQTCTVYFSEFQVENVSHIRETIGEETICIGFDFLKIRPGTLQGMIQFDRVIMNPPFSHGQDIDHVQHAFKFLKPGGILVAITAPGWTFRQDAKHTQFREWVETSGATYSELPAGTFKESGTMIRTMLLKIRK